METKDLDLATLEHVKTVFELYSDLSTRCLGYRYLSDTIFKIKKDQGYVKIYINDSPYWIRPVDQKKSTIDYHSLVCNVKHFLGLEDSNSDDIKIAFYPARSINRSRSKVLERFGNIVFKLSDGDSFRIEVKNKL